jgi:hypothetical protein
MSPRIQPAGAWMFQPALLTKGVLQKSRLHVVKTITGRVLSRGAIHQHLLQFLDRAGIEQREFAVFEPGMALA